MNTPPNGNTPPPPPPPLPPDPAPPLPTNRHLHKRYIGAITVLLMSIAGAGWWAWPEEKAPSPPEERLVPFGIAKLPTLECHLHKADERIIAFVCPMADLETFSVVETKNYRDFLELKVKSDGNLYVCDPGGEKGLAAKVKNEAPTAEKPITVSCQPR